MTAAIGQVPPIQDRAHRLFLQALREQVVKLSQAAGSGNTDAIRAELLRAIAALSARISALENQSPGSSTGDDAVFTAAATISQYQVVAAAATGLEPASHLIAGHAGSVAGIALGAAAAGGTLPVARTGDVVENQAWAWSVPSVLWLGQGGALSTTPGVGWFAQSVALAIEPTRVIVLLGEEWLQQLPGRARYTAGAALSALRFVRPQADGSMVYASNADASAGHCVQGMTTHAAALGEPVELQESGRFTDPSWNWTPNEPIWLGANGVPTQTPPSSPDFTLPVAFAVSATTLDVRILTPIF